MKFSVIIIAYNVETLVENAIQSVLKQTFKNYELILVDDCSKDSTIRILEKYKDVTTVIKHNINKGAGGARNSGVNCSKGEYILYLDADDILYDETILEKINNIIGDDTPDLVYFGYEEVGGLNRTFLPTEQNTQKESRLSTADSVSVCSKCWNKQYLNKINLKFYENMFYEDMMYSFKGTALANTWKFGKFPIFKYTRDRKGSVMTSASIKRCSDIYRYLACMMDLYGEMPDEFKDYIMKFILEETENMPETLNRILTALSKNSNIPPPKKDIRNK